jgi:hypothetical protein
MPKAHHLDRRALQLIAAATSTAKADELLSRANALHMKLSQSAIDRCSRLFRWR